MGPFQNVEESCGSQNQSRFSPCTQTVRNPSLSSLHMQLDAVCSSEDGSDWLIVFEKAVQHRLRGVDPMVVVNASGEKPG